MAKIKSLPFEQLCKEYAYWRNSSEYNEEYKWEFQKEYGQVFASVTNSQRFKKRYFELLSYPDNLMPWMFRRGGRQMMKDLFDKYPEIHIKLFQELFDENLPLADRINHFAQKLDTLREKEGYAYALRIVHFIPEFFLFVYDYTKYPLASVNKFIKDYFAYMNVEEAKKLRGLDLYLFYRNYILETLLPRLQNHLHRNCSTIDAQDFFWFVAKWICDGYRAGKSPRKSDFSPRAIGVEKEDLILETEYSEDVDSTTLTKTDRKKLNEILNKPPTREQVSQTKFQRNPKMAKLALEDAGFKCETGCENKTFISAASGKPYMEAHHLIPMPCSDVYFERFHVSLDRPENIVSICPACHRAIHLGTDNIKLRLLKRLFEKKKSQLSNIGIKITLQELIRHYEK